MTPHFAALLFAMVGPNDFTIAIPHSPETAEGQRLIAQRALQVCRRRYRQLGRYRFTGAERIVRDGKRSAEFVVAQELACLDAPPPPPAPAQEPAPADWQPTAEDERQVQELTRRYFALLDAGDAKQAHSLWSPENRAEMPLDARAAQINGFRDQAGKPGEHRIAALTWYVNPPDAPAPGIYVAADYERSYEKLALNCGYLMWYRGADGSYVLVREENNMMARQATEPSLQSLSEARALMRCRDR